MIHGLVTTTRAAAAYRLPELPHLRLRLTLAAEARASLPCFLGSTLRGAFGHALRRAVCAMGPAQPCAACGLRRACPYTRVFETFLDREPPPLLAGLDTAPRAYVIEPPAFVPERPGTAGRRELAPGDPLGFDLVLLGQAIDLAPYALLAVERMARAGLGADRARFRLARAAALAPDGRWRELGPHPLAPSPGSRPPAPGEGERVGTGPPESGPLMPGPPPRPLRLGDRATIRLLTPLRLTRDHRPADGLGARALLFAMLRRVLELAHVHVPGAAVDWSFRGYLAGASRVRVTRADLAWHDVRRYSNRQGRAMTLGGLVGTVELAGDLAPFAPLFALAEVVHAGKGATFGLGQVEVTP